MKTSFRIESTTTGFTVRAITEKPNGKTTTRVAGRARNEDEVDGIIEAFERRLGLLQTT